MPAVAVEDHVAGAESRDNAETLGRPRRALGDAVAHGGDKGRPAAGFGQPPGDQADDAGVPVVAVGEDRSVGGGELLRRRQHILGGLLAPAIQLFQFQR